jgi:hypothetical protein
MTSSVCFQGDIDCWKSRTLHGASPLNNPDEHGSHSDDQKNMDEPTDGVPADQAKGPQQQHDNKYRPQHGYPPSLVIS